MKERITYATYLAAMFIAVYVAARAGGFSTVIAACAFMLAVFKDGYIRAMIDDYFKESNP